MANKQENPLAVYRALISPADIIAGIGAADRHFLATCLALFDDSALHKRLFKWWQNTTKTLSPLTGDRLGAIAESVQSTQKSWLTAPLSDDHLRVALWMYLRRAFGLAPQLSASLHGGRQLADDLVARMISEFETPVWRRKVADLAAQFRRQDSMVEEVPLTYADIAGPVLEELGQQLSEVSVDDLDAAERESALEAVRKSLSRMSDEDRIRLQKELQVDSLNDRALLQAVLASGGLTAIGSGVALGGFSAYIMVAKMSAFIPLVSGPGLVSFVAVLANPVVGSALALAATWGAKVTAENKIRRMLALRIAAMLAVQGLGDREGGAVAAVSAMSCAGTLESCLGLEQSLIDGYKGESQKIERVRSLQNSGGPPTLRACWSRPVLPPAAENEVSDSQEYANAIAFAGLTLGELLYSAAAIDPEVIAAADFSYVADIDGPLSFASVLEHLPGMSAVAAAGTAARLKGYVAEQVVAAELVRAGHVVSFPGSASEPGWDLLVDGERMQVKFHDSLSGISEHFSRYDYPVIANAELAESVPEEWADRVFFIDGLTDDVITQSTNRSIAAAENLNTPDVPIIAVAISAYRATEAYRHGKVSLTQAAEQVLSDGAVRAGLAVVGQVVGSGAGLLLFGPAGAWVFGISGPVLAQSFTTRAHGVVKKLATGSEYDEWQNLCHTNIDQWHNRLTTALEKKQDQLALKHGQVRDTDAAADAYIRWRLADHQTFLDESRVRLASLDARYCPDLRERIGETGRWLAKAAIHPAAYQAELAAVERALKAEPTLSDTGKDVFATGSRALAETATWAKATFIRVTASANERWSATRKSTQDKSKSPTGDQ